MRFVFFVQSLISAWNHGNAHFLRGVTTELITRGHEVVVYEPKNSWSLMKLVKYHGEGPIRSFYEYYPDLCIHRYDPELLDLHAVLEGADVVIVHEWNDHALVRSIGQHRKVNPTYRLLFHDTHHRSVTDSTSMGMYDLSQYDGVLAFGEVITSLYLQRSWIQHAWTWHEAADIRIFRPLESHEYQGDIVWIGNWGDEERSAELNEFLFSPVKEQHLKCRVYGVRYPDEAHQLLTSCGIEYAGWLPNYRVPQVFSRYRVTVHIPRRPYVTALPGIPTIRPFEALACGIPLVCSPWHDTEHLFIPGKDYLVARTKKEMKDHLQLLLHDKKFADELSAHGLQTILNHHTCAHRVSQLLSICTELGIARSVPDSDEVLHGQLHSRRDR